MNKCPDIFRKCPTGTELRIAYTNPGKVNNPFGTTQEWAFQQTYSKPVGKYDYLIISSRNLGQDFGYGSVFTCTIGIQETVQK